MDLYATGELNEKEKDDALDKILQIDQRMEDHQEIIVKEKVIEIKSDNILRY